MAASHNLPQLSISRKTPINKCGVLTLCGFGVRVRMQSGHLEIEDGVGMERRTIRLPRVGHGVKRLVCISEDGFATLGALKWLADVGISFLMLNRNGKVLFLTGSVGSSDSKLRRSQALASSNGVGLEICRTLIDAKLQGQEQVLRERLNCHATADTITRFRNKLASAESFDVIRNLEANAASAYFSEWRDLPVAWPKADLQRIPGHWRFVGRRQSPLTGGPRLAVTPAHAVLNYCFSLVECETRLAISALGLDAGLGMGLHTDTANRDSLAFDVLEPVRPHVEGWLLDWIAREPLRRADFFETATGNCRLMSRMCNRLSQTTSVWGKLIAPWAEYVARTLWAEAKSGRSHNFVPPTRLTQQRRTEAKGKVWINTVELPKAAHLCQGCGKTIRDERTNCGKCAVSSATERLVSAARIGRVASRTPEALAKQSEAQRRHAKARSSWDPSSQPEWLTSELFSQQIQPLLAGVSTAAIRSHLGVSRWYAGRVRQGYRPHPRHWQALARLVGIPPDLQLRAVMGVVAGEIPRRETLRRHNPAQK